MGREEWNVAASLPEKELMKQIMTACIRPEQFTADPRLLSYLGNRNESLRVLDFGCGLGRNCLGVARYSDLWSVTGYDLPAMTVRASEYIHKATSDADILRRITITDSLDTAVEEYRPNVVLSCWCFQHIDEWELLDILPWMGENIPRMIVSGRTWMDDGKKSTFALIESCGWKRIKIHDRDKRNPLGEHRVVEYASPAANSL